MGKLQTTYLGLPLGTLFKSPSTWDVMRIGSIKCKPFGKDNIY